MVKGNETTSALFEGIGVCVTACQLVDNRFVVDVNCQVLKLLDQKNRRVVGGTRDIESVGSAASAVHAIANRHHEI